MKITIKFMGTLGQDLSGIDQSGQIALNLPHGSQVIDIFKYYKIPIGQEYTSVINNKVARPSDMLLDGMTVTLLQTVYGG